MNYRLHKVNLQPWPWLIQIKQLFSTGFSDVGEVWRAKYETESFEEDLERLNEEARSLYENLHAYIRRKIIEKYGPDLFPDTGQMPAHLGK